MLNKNCKHAGLKHFTDSKAFVEYSNNVDDIYKNNPNKKCKTLIVFNDMIADILSTTKRNTRVTKLVITGKKLNIYLAFITQSYFAVPKKY